MRTFRALVLVAASVILVGCINSATLVKVKPDGSGTIEQTTLVNTSALKSMMPGGQATETPGSVINKADLERQAERMGKGVRLVSAEPASGGGFEGVKAIYAFDDINQVEVNQDPSMSGTSDGQFNTAPPKNESPIKFTLTKNGANPVLTIQLQDKPTTADAAPAGPAGGPDMADPAVLNMMKAMFDGFKVAIDVEVLGSIVNTNAEYVEGSRVTLLEMDMGALFADQEKLKALQGKVKPGASLSEVKPYLKDVKGIKIDGPTVNVEFK